MTRHLVSVEAVRELFDRWGRTPKQPWAEGREMFLQMLAALPVEASLTDPAGLEPERVSFAPDAWRPVSTHNKAPMLRLVAWAGVRASPERGVFDRHIGGGMWRSADKKGNPLFDPQPTHWMPLPSPPAQVTAEKETTP